MWYKSFCEVSIVNDKTLIQHENNATYPSPPPSLFIDPPYIISITITITVVIETRRREGAREAVNVLSLG